MVILAAELLKRGNELIAVQKLHPTTVLSGYRLALKAAISYIKKSMIIPVDTLNEKHLLQAAKTSMNSKLLDDAKFAQLTVDAVLSVENKATKKYPINAIHILKAHGSGQSSLLQNGFAIAATRAAQGMPTSLTNCKIACLDMNLQRHRMGLGVSITVTDPAQVAKIQKRELDITKEKIDKILKKANVILTTKGIDDVCLKYFVEAGAICARRIPKEDLQRLAKATGASVMTSLANMEGDEEVEDENLGSADSVSEVRLGEGELLQFEGCGGEGASTIILRGANEYMLDEMDRSLHDALCVVKRMLESKSLLPGGGAVEAALSVYLEEHARSNYNTREQLAIEEFAEALLIIPKTLAVNAAKDSSDLVAQLRAKISSNPNFGLDLEKGEIRDNLEAGVVEPAVSKIKALRFATEAAITILRIDDKITVTKA